MFRDSVVSVEIKIMPSATAHFNKFEHCFYTTENFVVPLCLEMKEMDYAAKERLWLDVFGLKDFREMHT